MNDEEQTRRIAETICEQFAWNGRSFSEGDFVAILDDKIIAVTRTPDEAITVLRALEPDPKRGLVIEVTHPVVDIIR